MSNVLQFKQKPVKGLVPRGPDLSRLWVCVACQNNSFRLDMDGEVWCAKCDGWIKNLRVVT